MNRIILIGNGFDLAHNLKTSYMHFINYCMDNIAFEYFDGMFKRSIKIKPDGSCETNELIIPIRIEEDIQPQTFLNLKTYLSSRSQKLRFKNKFLGLLEKKAYIENWVDVEEEYFSQVKAILNNKSELYSEKVNSSAIQQLNKDFYKIKIKLEEYLVGQMDGFDNNFIYENFQYKFNLLDFTSDGVSQLGKEYSSDKLGAEMGISSLMIERTKDISIAYHYYSTKVYPDNVLLLNFNYTNLPVKLLQEIKKNAWELGDWAKVPMSTIQIHGGLHDYENSMIFGYGDEDNEIQKEIEKRGGDYLDNIKTINYTKTPDYKKLINYIESDSYQVFIWGHSCGLSDKTLLKTLFENQNCVSIKPFYYINEEQKNNYDDIIKNIYRVFSNKAIMRDKVVNKEYCSQIKQLKE